jgi:hypothetical protein
VLSLEREAGCVKFVPWLRAGGAAAFFDVYLVNPPDLVLDP